MSQENMDLDELTELMLQGEGSDMEMAIRGQGQGAGLERLMYFLQVGYFSRRIYDKFDWEAIERDLSRIMQMLEAQGLDPGMLARIRNYLDLRLEAFRRMIRQHVERELERRAYRQGEKLSREVLTDKPLFALSPDEVAQMKAVVARLARKIKDALAMRQRQEEKGRLDSRRREIHRVEGNGRLGLAAESQLLANPHGRIAKLAGGGLALLESPPPVLSAPLCGDPSYQWIPRIR